MQIEINFYTAFNVALLFLIPLYKGEGLRPQKSRFLFFDRLFFCPVTGIIKNKKTAAYSPRNEFTTGRRPRPERSQNLNCRPHFYCKPQINRAHAVPPTFASFFALFLKIATGNKTLITFVAFALLNWQAGFFEGLSEKTRKAVRKKTIRQKQTAKPKIKRQIGKIDALSFFPVTGDNRRRLLSFTGFYRNR